MSYVFIVERIHKKKWNTQHGQALNLRVYFTVAIVNTILIVAVFYCYCVLIDVVVVVVCNKAVIIIDHVNSKLILQTPFFPVLFHVLFRQLKRLFFSTSQHCSCIRFAIQQRKSSTCSVIGRRTIRQSNTNVVLSFFFLYIYLFLYFIQSLFLCIFKLPVIFLFQFFLLLRKSFQHCTCFQHSRFSAFLRIEFYCFFPLLTKQLVPTDWVLKATPSRLLSKNLWSLVKFVSSSTQISTS